MLTKKDGFTLVEIMVAIFIIALSTLFIMQAMNNLSLSIIRSNHFNEAMEIESILLRKLQMGKIDCDGTFGQYFNNSNFTNFSNVTKDKPIEVASIKHYVQNIVTKKYRTEDLFYTDPNPQRLSYSQINKIYLSTTKDLDPGLEELYGIGNKKVYEGLISIEIGAINSANNRGQVNRKTMQYPIIFDLDGSRIVSCSLNHSLYISLKESCEKMFNSTLDSNLKCRDVTL